MRRSVALLAAVWSLSATSAIAEPAFARIVENPDGTFVAATPALSAAITKLVRETEHAHPAHDSSGGRWDCERGLVDNVMVNLRCLGVKYDALGGYRLDAFVVMLVVGDKLVPAGFEDLLEPDAHLADKLAKIRPEDHAKLASCKRTTGTIFVTDSGIEVYGASDDNDRCSYTWQELAPLLKHGSAIARLAAAKVDDPYDQNTGDSGATAPAATAHAAPSQMSPNRFVADGADAVRDTETNLDWAAHDNGADLDADAAAAYAKAFRGGGHADWRLPSADELAALATPELAHREPGDCTHGKTNLLITPLIHLSCGLAWSSTAGKAGTIGFGFISGNPRVSKRTETKNYRALVVRGP